MTILTVTAVIIAVQLLTLSPYIVRASLSNEAKLACENSPIPKLSEWDMAKMFGWATGLVLSLQLIGFLVTFILNGGHA